MCVSPDEMSVDQLTRHLEYYKENLANLIADETSEDDWWRNTVEGRIEEFEQLLKQKAEEGEMLDA